MMELAAKAIAELGTAVSDIDSKSVEEACEAITSANKIMVYSCGREALQLRGFAMRLHHLGLSVSVQGDMTAPPLGEGDLLIVSAGPGELSTVTALMRVAADAGARILFLTAQPEAQAALLAGIVLTIPAQTMASDQGNAATSVLPMGSLYEGALFVLFEVMVLQLKQRLDINSEDMRARHTNME